MKKLIGLYNTWNKPIIRMIKYHPLLIGRPITTIGSCQIKLPVIRAAPYDVSHINE